MNFTIKALPYFKEQVMKLDTQSRRIIHEKIQLVRENPYRNKKIHSRQFSKVFRIRLSLHAKETRLVYVVIEPSIILVCLLDRKKEYKDLEKFLAKFWMTK